jgi:DNA-binding MarR family transcriptional regulator
MTAGSTVFERAMRSQAGIAPLTALDPDLARGIDAEDAIRVERLLRVRTMYVAEGPWEPGLRGGPRALGLLVVGGLLLRRVEHAGGCSAELIGAGDVIRPWQADDESLLDSRTRWHVADDARLALLDAKVTAALAQWPTIASELFGRTLQRSRWLALQQAISQVRPVEHRMLLYLWHLGERFGRVTTGGLAVRVPLTHERLANLIGVHRPSVTTALRNLERGGLVVRGDDYEFVLTQPARELVAEVGS